MPVNIALPSVSPKVAGTAVLVLAAALVGYNVFFNVSKGDAILHQKFERAVGGQVISAGDIVAVAHENRRSVEPLCKFDVATERTIFARGYVNGLAEDLPKFLAVLKRAFGDGATDRSERGTLREVRLWGHSDSLPASEQPDIPERCFGAISAAVASGHAVCVVARAMVQTSFVPVDPADPSKGGALTRETVGLTFRSSGITTADKRAMACSGISGFGPAVRLRHTLDVIREFELVGFAAAAAERG